MEEQKWCSKCGHLNWSRWAVVCECKEPNFIFYHYVDYLKYLEENKKPS